MAAAKSAGKRKSQDLIPEAELRKFELYCTKLQEKDWALQRSELWKAVLKWYLDARMTVVEGKVELKYPAEDLLKEIRDVIYDHVK